MKPVEHILDHGLDFNRSKHIVLHPLGSKNLVELEPLLLFYILARVLTIRKNTVAKFVRIINAKGKLPDIESVTYSISSLSSMILTCPVAWTSLMA